MKDFRKLTVWQKGHELTILIYRITGDFPQIEQFGMTSQMRRAAYSIPSNIAEGCGRDGDRELKRFVNISLGSACELDYFVLLAGELGYLSADEHQNLAQLTLDLRNQLGAFIRKLKA